MQTQTKDIELLDVENLLIEEKERLEKVLFTVRPMPFFMFYDRFLFSLHCKKNPDKTELAIIVTCLKECAQKLRAYYDYAGKKV